MGTTGPQGALGATGPSGPQGIRGVTPRGDWAVGTAYNPDDLVLRDGSTYRAKLASTGVAPESDAGKWQLFAAKGAVGATGVAGAAGAAGAAGSTGAAGATGPQGATGAQGPIGSTGAQGALGAAGPAGPQGGVFRQPEGARSSIIRIFGSQAWFRSTLMRWYNCA